MTAVSHDGQELAWKQPLVTAYCDGPQVAFSSRNLSSGVPLYFDPKYYPGLQSNLSVTLQLSAEIRSNLSAGGSRGLVFMDIEN